MGAIASLTKRNFIATSSRARSRSSMLIVYEKEGIYHEHVVIGRHLNHLMFVGDGIDRTMITGSKRGFGELDDRKMFSSGISLPLLVLWFHCASLLLGLWESRWIIACYLKSVFAMWETLKFEEVNMKCNLARGKPVVFSVFLKSRFDGYVEVCVLC
ncbi:hypothetical protein Droror1_Dr00023258 [Drosera rotundifolia]